MRSWPDPYDPVESYWSDEPRIPGERLHDVETKRRWFVGGLAALAALLPATTLARRVRLEQVGCPPRCFINRRGKCCERTYDYVSGVCLKNPRECGRRVAARCGSRCD